MTENGKPLGYPSKEELLELNRYGLFLPFDDGGLEYMQEVPREELTEDHPCTILYTSEEYDIRILVCHLQPLSMCIQTVSTNEFIAEDQIDLCHILRATPAYARAVKPLTYPDESDPPRPEDPDPTAL